MAGALGCAVGGRIDAAAPTGILLSSASMVENSPAHAKVATLRAVDADAGDKHVFKMAPGDGGDDNHRFWISGNQLLLQRAELDFESVPLARVRLRVEDSTLQTYEQAFVIEVIDDRHEDADGDGFTEELEEDGYGTSDVRFDTDGDGVGDKVELDAGYSPTDRTVWPRMAILGWGKANEGEQAMPSGEGFVALATGQNHSLAMSAAGEVVGWGGMNTYGQTTVPAGLGEVVELAAGGDFWPDDSAHSLALRSDGTVAGWGYGQDGKIVAPAGLGQVLAIAAGRSHGLALKYDGTVVAWGYNPFGSVQPPAALGDVVAVSAGGFQSLALKSNGTVVAWGNYFDGTRWVESAVPVGLSDVVAISAGRFHSLALRSDGTVAAWGYNLNGQATVPAGLGDVVAVAAGGFHSLALKSDGSVVAWGLNSDGQTTVPLGARSGVNSISAGILHSLAVPARAGSPAITSSPLILGIPGAAFEHPVIVENAGDTVLEFSASGLPAGLTIDPVSGVVSGMVAAPVRNTVRIRVKTGQGVLTQLAWVKISDGLPPTSVALTPAMVGENSPPGTWIGSLSATDPDGEDGHTFEWVDGAGSRDNRLFRIEGRQVIVDQAITRDYDQDPGEFSIRLRARDAMLNPHEQIITLRFTDDRKEDADGDGLTEEQEEDEHFTSDSRYDTDGDGFGDNFELHHGAEPGAPESFPSGRMVVAWGSGSDGQTSLPPGLGDVIELSAGGSHALALKGDGTVLAWGGNADGQTEIPAGLQGVTAVEAGSAHSLILKNDGTVAVWGDNGHGQGAIPAGLGGVVAISAGGFHNLALEAEGTVAAWGYNAYGQAAVPADLTGVVAVAAGGFHSLALKSDGTVVAWGSDWGGATVVPEGLAGVVAIAAGAYHSLALKHDGTVVAWGSNAQGQTVVPMDLRDVTAIAAGWLHSVALKADGTTVAWGNNSQGQAESPLEARQIRTIDAGTSHNLAIRQATGFPFVADVSPVRGKPGGTVVQAMAIENAAPTRFTAMGLPSGLVIDPVSGLVSGTVTTGERRAVRVAALTDQGTLSRVIWFNTADGFEPTDLSLSSLVLAENSPAGTEVATLHVVDPDVGDTHSFRLASDSGAPDSFGFVISGNKLTVRNALAADFDAGNTQLSILVVAVDSGNNTYERYFTLQLTDDRAEDADKDGINEAMEEDLFGTSDSVFDDFNTADADRDGISGMIEYAFNLKPRLAGPPLRLVPGGGSTAGLPAIGLVANAQGQRHLRLEYLRRVRGGLIYTPQFASGLNAGDWAPAANSVTVTPIDADWERCVVEDTQTTSAAARRFGRVAVQYVAGDRTQDADGDGISVAMEEDVFGTSDSVFDDFNTADADRDGISGMIEYAFNLKPKLAGPPLRLIPGGGSTAGLPAIGLAANAQGQRHLRLEYLRRVRGGLIYTPQFASGLNAGDWAPAANPVTVTPIDADWERCVVEDTQTTSAATRRFGRVAVAW